MKLETKLISSLGKVFPDAIAGEELRTASVLEDEPFSFQIAFRNDPFTKTVTHLYVRVETDLEPGSVSEYLVSYVPVMRADVPGTDGFFDRKTPGLYPDMLLRRRTNARVEDDGRWGPRYIEQDQDNLLAAVSDSYQALWFTVNEEGRTMRPGGYRIRVLFYNAESGEQLAGESLALEIVPAKLSENAPFYTNWFHCDCLADIYGTEVFSDRFFGIMRSFVKTAAVHGMNTILLPAFTPPLDTTPGKERRTAQLVGVEVTRDGYSFDFSLMKRYIGLCLECGIGYFEHSHLFTQWGAEHAPKVMAADGTGTRRIFGWETDAGGKEYTAFLKSYLRALKAFLCGEGLEKRILFHVSDEPDLEHLASYRRAREAVAEEMEGFPCADAVSHYEFYEKGLTERPIVVVSSPDMEKFVRNCGDYWVYYTGAQVMDGCSNRIIPATSARNRAIGVQMYAGGANGFLHWGYNYYYGFLSHGLFDPAKDPCGYNKLAGTCFVVYPGTGGEAIPSLRMKVFQEGLNDCRALRRLETLAGREAALAFLEERLGRVDYHFCPDGKTLLGFRESLNREIGKYL